MISFYLVMFLLPILVIALAVWLVKREGELDG
jgi:cytochrome oxidase assembly protein ShyY1